MKGLNMRQIVFWLVGIMIGSFALALIFYSTSEPGFAEGAINTEEVFHLDGVNRIHINTASTDINVIPVDASELRVHFHGTVRGTSSSVPNLVTSQFGDEIDIKIEYPRNIGLRIQHLKLDLYLPAEYQGDIDANTASADLNIRNLTLNRLSFKSASGDLNSTAVTVNEGHFGTASGNVDLTDYSGALNFRSASGDLDVSYTVLDADIQARTASGNVSISLPDSSEFYLRAKTVSGRIQSDFPVSVSGSLSKNRLEGRVGNGTNSIDVESASGNLRIRWR